MFMYGLIFMYAMWLPLLLMLGALGIALVLRSIGTPSWMRRGAGCAACGYELTTLGGGRCPECGASLIKVGVTTPRLAARLRGSMFLLVMGWTLTASAGAAPVLGLIGWLSSVQQMNQIMAGGGFGNLTGPCTVSMALVPGRMSDRGSLSTDTPEDYSIQFDADMITDESDTVMSGRLDLAFVDSPTKVIVQIDLLDKSWKLVGSAGVQIREGNSFSIADAMQIYRDAGLDVSKSTTLEELSCLSAAIDEFWYSPEWSMSDIFQSGSSLVAQNVVADWSQSGSAQSVTAYGGVSSFTSFDVWDIAFVGAIVACAVLYLLGLVVLILKRVRLMQFPAIG